MFLEQALQPAGRDPWSAAGVLPGDQHGQLGRVKQAQLRELSGCGYSRDDIPAVDRLLEDPVRVALRGRRSSSLGAGDGLSSPVPFGH
jgi:hypothetical protein